MNAKTYEATERIPTLDELMALPKAERSYWLRKAAEFAEPLYRNTPELTETADAIDLDNNRETPPG